MKKKIFYISISLLSIIVYALVFALIVLYKPSYEYTMYFKKQLTKYWAGDNTMTIDQNKVMRFNFEQNPVSLDKAEVKQTDLQFIGKNTNVKEDDGKLQYIFGNNINIYWQWKDDIEFNELTLNIKIKATTNFNVKINGQNEVEGEASADEFEVVGFNLKFEKQNSVCIYSNQELQIVEMYFS